MKLYFFIAAGSKLEQVIGDGADALNAYISSGEIEELKDVIPLPDIEENEIDDDEEEDDETQDSKRLKIERIVNHNAQVIYNNNDSNSQPAIPSLMAIDVKVDVPLGKDGAGNWGPGGFNKNAPNQPPSLLNLNVAPPFDDIGSGSGGGGGSGGWQSSRADYNNRNSKDGQKRRNRDSDGNRISRFDRESGGGSRSSRFENNDSGRNRRSGNSNSGSSRQERSSGRSNRRI